MNQFGRDSPTAPEIRTSPDTCELRVIGTRSSAAGALPRNCLVFRGGKPGTDTIYLDNLGVSHTDGSTTLVCKKRKGARAQIIADTELSKDITVRTVDAAEFRK